MSLVSSPFNQWLAAEPCVVASATSGVLMEQLTVFATNQLANLTNVPDQQLLILFVNGQAFFPVGALPDFSVSGQTITWLNTGYSISSSAIVIAAYTWSALPVLPSSVPSTQEVDQMTTQLLLNQWVTTDACSTTMPMPAVIRNALYYAATAGQTVFNLATPDLFGNSYVMVDNNVDVFRTGGKLVPDNGTGVGGYTADFTSNSITLAYPAGAGEAIEIDFFVSAS